MNNFKLTLSSLKRKVLTKGDPRKFIPLIIATFVLSIFAGILLSLVVRQWMLSNIEVIKRVQAREEALKIERLLDQSTYHWQLK